MTSTHLLSASYGTRASRVISKRSFALKIKQNGETKLVLPKASVRILLTCVKNSNRHILWKGDMHHLLWRNWKLNSLKRVPFITAIHRTLETKEIEVTLKNIVQTNLETFTTKLVQQVSVGNSFARRILHRPNCQPFRLHSGIVLNDEDRVKIFCE